MSNETTELEGSTEVANPLEPIVRRELIHTYLGCKADKFMQDIDNTGGWPVGYTHVSFYHSVENTGRYCQFTTYPLRTGWWTTVATADDYYYWKLSDTKKAEILKEARQQLIRQLR